MAEDEVILKFSNVSFEWGINKPILTEASFSVRKGSKITLMGQNGAGKSTIFQLITGESKPESGAININNNLTTATAKQVIPREDLNLTVKEFFEKCFSEKVYDIDKKIDDILEIVNFTTPHDRPVKNLSGGQQARILLA